VTLVNVECNAWHNSAGRKNPATAGGRQMLRAPPGNEEIIGQVGK
jgi:hypothetical protein